MSEFIPYDKYQRKVIAGAKRIARKCRRAIGDAAVYNASYPEYEPLDVEGFRVAAYLADRVLALARRRELIPDELIERMETALNVLEGDPECPE